MNMHVFHESLCNQSLNARYDQIAKNEEDTSVSLEITREALQVSMLSYIRKN